MGEVEGNALKTYLPSGYPGAVVTLTCRIPYSDDRWGNMKHNNNKKQKQKHTAGGGGMGWRVRGAHTFTSGKGHLLLTELERS